MSRLVVIGFVNRYQADQALLTLRSLERDYHGDLADACVVIRNDDGEVELRQSQRLTPSGIVGGDFWKMLIGALFTNPLAGILPGGRHPALIGGLSDIGINDDFLREIGRIIRPGSSALFVLARVAKTEQMLTDMDPLGGQVMQISLSKRPTLLS